MRRIKGNGTIDQNCGFKLEYLTGSPTTSISTGDRWYTGKEKGKPVLVYHTEGTSTNSSTTKIFAPNEIKSQFTWAWNNDPDFAQVKKWVKKHI